MSSTEPLPLTLSELLERLEPAGPRLIGDGNLQVHDARENSKEIQPGSLFVARRGQRVDGTRFIPDAFARGAVAVLCERGSGLTIEPRIEVEHLSLAFALAAEELAGRPSSRLRVVGITGTNGKTTTASLVDQALTRLGIVSARLGTLGFWMGDTQLFETLTTPQPDALARALALAVERHAEVCVMEVSSHALAQERVGGVRFDVTAFTNLSQDHLDYHGTFEEYARTKSRLFTEYPSRQAVLQGDDPYGELWGTQLPSAWLVSARRNEQAKISASSFELSIYGVSAQIRVDGKTHPFASGLVGLHNLENLLLALGILLALRVEVEPALRALSECVSVPGRLERCDRDEEEADALVGFVDYAHTPDALRRVLATLRDVTDRPIVCVFGCGGDRDRSKRAPMGRAVAEIADVIWLTSDNPRTEDPASILDDVRPGLSAARGQVFEEIDRAVAIRAAVLRAPDRAVILVAGKGHETYQLVGEQKLPFDDRIELRSALEERRARRREGEG